MNRCQAMLAAAFSALWLLDTAATVGFVMQAGVAAEANPVMRAAMVAWGLDGFAIVKAGILGFWLCLSHRVHVGIHAALVAVMVPVVFMGLRVWG